MGDQEAPYIIAKISASKYQTRYKFIRDMKKFAINKFKEDFKLISFSTVYDFDDQEDQLGMLNKLVLNCIEGYAPLRRVKTPIPGLRQFLATESPLKMKENAFYFTLKALSVL